MPTIGDTVRITAKFHNFDGDPVSPTGVVFRVYDGRRVKVGDDVALLPTGVGTYQHDYVVPSDGVGPLYYEITGTLDGNPVLARAELGRRWV